MTGSDDSNSSTRPISVAELLARNGTIGAPPLGGRRRRRRGNADAVTVAELTGEIPIIRPDDPPPVAATVAPVEPPVEEPIAEPAADVDEAPATNGAVDYVVELDEVEPDEEAAEPEVESAQVESADVEADEAEAAEVDESDVAEAAEVDDVQPDTDTGTEDNDDDYADAVAEYAARLEKRGTEPEPTDEQPTRRFGLGRFGRKDPAVDAEKWTPDPVDEGGAATEGAEDLAEPTEIEELDDQTALDSDAEDEGDDKDELPSYLRSTEEPLFGGQTVADDLARRGSRPSADDIDLDEDDDDEYGEPRRMSSVVHGLWIVGQSVIAVVFGAGLFVAFDQLWKWNNIVALVLSVLVILGLVVGVRVVRKTEDIGSTLIAVAVGALVTLGPLALLQSG